jgi:hypothetical protein
MLPLCTSVTVLRPDLERVADGVAHQPLGAEDGDGLDAHAGIGADLLLAALEQIVVEELDQPRRVRVPCLNSMPAYTSSVFSRKMTMSSFSGCFTGLGTPW